MKLESINNQFAKMATFLINHRISIFIFFIAILGVSFIGTKKIIFETSWDSYFVEDDPMLIQTDKFKEIFGNDYYVAVLAECDSLFTPQNLTLVRELSNELRDSLSYSEGKVTSLTDVEYMLGTEEGMEIIQIVPENIPTDSAGLATIKARISAKPELTKNLISQDGRFAWILAKLRPFPEDSVWKAEGKVAPDMQTGEETRHIIEKEKYAALHLKATGMPYLSYEKMQFVGKEMGRIMIIAIIFAIIVMIIVTHSLRGVVAPLFSTFAGLLITFGIAGYTGLYMDSTTIMIPVILAFAVSIAYNIHLYSFFRKEMLLHGKRKKAVIHSVRETGWSILFSGLTTIVALLSFLSVMLKPIRFVGIHSAISVLFILLSVLIISPILLSFGKDKKPNSKVLEHGETRFSMLMERMGHFVLAHPRPILSIFILLSIISIFGIFKVEPAFDVERTVGRKVDYVNKLLYLSNTELGSLYSYDITIEFNEQDEAKQVENLKKLEKMTQLVENYPLTKRTTSILNILKDLNCTLNENKTEFYKIPENENEIAQLLLLYENAGGSEAGYWIDYEYKYLRLMVEINSYNSNEVEQELADITQKTQAMFPNAKVTAVGSLPQFTTMMQYLVKGQLSSFLVSIIIVSVLIMIAFGSIRTGLIGMIPNITPAIFVGGYIGWAGIPLDMMMATLIPMLIGLSVDDTIHFINHGHLEYERSGRYRHAIFRTFRTTGPALVMTTLIMSVTFSGFMTSSSIQIFNFGFITIIGMVSALLSDLFITPILFQYFHIFGKEKAK